MNAGHVASEPLLRATSRIVSIHADILALSSREDTDWRRELIALRRRLQEEITGIATLIHAMQGEKNDLQRLNNAFARMRSAVALHQANWPAVAIDRNHPDYRKSVGDIRAANRDFVTLVGTLPSASAS